MKSLLKVVGLASTLAFCSSAAMAGVTLKLGHAAPESDLQQNMSLFFKKEVEARTGGDVKVNIFPNGLLGNDAQMIDGTRSGILDISMVGLNKETQPYIEVFLQIGIHIKAFNLIPECGYG